MNAFHYVSMKILSDNISANDKKECRKFDIILLTFIVDGIDDMHRTGKKAVRLLVQAEADAAF